MKLEISPFMTLKRDLSNKFKGKPKKLCERLSFDETRDLVRGLDETTEINAMFSLQPGKCDEFRKASPDTIAFNLLDPFFNPEDYIRLLTPTGLPQCRIDIEHQVYSGRDCERHYIDCVKNHYLDLVRASGDARRYKIMTTLRLEFDTKPLEREE